MVIRTPTETHCFNPRDYQVELLDKACKRNIIVQLGTGSGKTFIAVLLLKEYGLQIFAPFRNGGKRAFFIVEKVNLVDQQAEHIECHTTFRVGRIHGQLKTEVWESKEKCDEYIEKHHVIVITAQCLLDLLLHAYVKMDDVCVMIFDECHHALGSKHPYRLIMADYKKLKSDGREVPRVLGLTASLIKERTAPNKLEEKLSKLEAIMDCAIETASDLVSLSKFGAKPHEGVVYCRNFKVKKEFENIFNIIETNREFFTTTTEFNPDLDLDPRRPIHESLKVTKNILEQLGPWAAWKLVQVWEKELNKLIKTQSLPDKAKQFLNVARTTMDTIKRVLEPKMKAIKTLAELRQYVPHKLMRLFEILEMFSPEFQRERMGLETPEQLCAIIFVDQRYVAYALHLLVKQARQWDPKYKFLMSDYVVGASGNNLANSENQGLHKRQGEVLRKFHRCDLNVLIATSVLEEGVDVKQCNVVVKFDRPLDMRSYIQSKGRARRAGARYISLVEEKDVAAYNDDLRDFHLIEKLLLNRYRIVHNPVEDDVAALCDDVDLLVEPYVVEATGATVKMSNAIQLVNRYCSKLPSDIFTRLVPHNRIIPVEQNSVTVYRAQLLLPINSPIKHAIELKTGMPSKKLAQMAVALEACRQLHQKGELDDSLLPKGRESIAKLLEHIDDEPDEYAPGMCAKVGSAKRKQLYDKKVARVLNHGLPKAENEMYMYVLDMQRMREPEAFSNPKKRKFADPHSYEYCFGFMCATKLPKVPPFPVYLRQGDMRVRLVLTPNKIKVGEQELEQIKCFHDYLFTQVLQLCKAGNLEFMMNESTPMNTLIVPLNKHQTNSVQYTINMEYVSQVVANMRKMPRVPEEASRKGFKFRVEDYKDAIVMPWYRNVEQPAFYYVAEILGDMRPSSKFPDENYETFNDYFIKKYNIEIYDQDQSLLDVDFTSSRLNLLLPRQQSMKRRLSVAATSTSDITVDSDAQESVGQHSNVADTPQQVPHNQQRQILVPELMDVHPISANLWNLISALPSVFYRINHLLLTDELRQIIVTSAFNKKKEDVQLADDLEWPALKYPATYEEKQSLIVNKIQQLREINKKNSKDSEEKMKENEQLNQVFTIGVWDPEDAIRCGVDISLSSVLAHQKTYADGDEDTVGLVPGLGTDGNISDEDDDLGPFVMHDYKARLTSQARALDDAWQPREDIIESGWGDLEEVIEDSEFKIIGTGIGTCGVDLRGLMEDVGRVIVQPTVVPTETATSTKSNETTGPSTTSTSATALPQPDKIIKDKETLEQILKAKKKLEALDLLDTRDKSSRRQEEIIDLEQFDDGDEEVDIISAPMTTSDDEFEELTSGETTKTAQDARALRKTRVVKSAEREKGVILSSTANPSNHRFSFARESPMMASMDKVVPSTKFPTSRTPSPTTVLVQKEEVSDTGISHADMDVGYGISPCLLLTALTTSNAGDGMSLERFETIGDSFLKFAVTDYLYHTHVNQHEGKLSFARSKEVSNCNLYRLGKKLGVPQLLVASKFDAHDAWLPPCYVPTVDFKAPNTADAEEEDTKMEMLLSGQAVEDKIEKTTGWDETDATVRQTKDGVETINFPKRTAGAAAQDDISPLPYNLLTQQNISDKSIADAMEALIGVHLLSLGPNPTLKVMNWMGLKVLDKETYDETELHSSLNPLLRFIDTPAEPNASIRALDKIWEQFQFGKLETKLGYRFKDRAYLVQAFTHASYINNRVTGCYQRLEFLGDAVLDYMITRYLFEDVRQYSPGVLTDLRSALVNNTIFASLAVKYEFQKHFIAMCPGLHHMIEKFVKLCTERNFFDANFNTEMYMVTTEEEIDEGQEEDIEVPKAMGDIFESVAGAIYLDSGRDLDTVWTVIYRLMRDTIEECCANPPRSPIRELMELESSKARFSKMERIIESAKVRVTVDVGNNMRFTGMGRNYRIAKTTAAKRALRYLKSLEEQKLRAQKLENRNSSTA